MSPEIRANYDQVYSLPPERQAAPPLRQSLQASLGRRREVPREPLHPQAGNAGAGATPKGKYGRLFTPAIAAVVFW